MSGVPTGLEFGDIIDSLTDAMLLRRARQGAQTNRASAQAWQEYAWQLETVIAQQHEELRRLKQALELARAKYEGLGKLEQAVANEGIACPNHLHHKISRDHRARLEIFDKATKISATQRGVIYEPQPLALPKG